MSSTFMGLETSKRGLTAQQTALYTVGHNISNANTIGYTRQRVNLVATDGFPSPGMNSPKMAGHLGTGVTSDSVQRIRDSFIDTQYRQESTNLGYWSAKAKEVSQLEDIFSEPSEYGLNKSFDDFYQALQTLSTNPSNAAARQVVAEKGVHLADSFNYINKQLTQVQTNLKNNIRVETKNVNSLLTQIASLNKQISTLEPNGYLPNDLYDQRDNLLDSLSEYFKIETTRVPSGGNAKANAEGSLDVFIKLDDGSKIQVVKGAKEATMVSNFSQSKTTGIDYSDDYGAFISFGFTDATYITKEGTILATDDKGITLKDPNGHNIYLNADDKVLLTDAQGNLVKDSAGKYVTNEGMNYYEKVGSDTFVKDIEGNYIKDASGANTKVDTSKYQAVDADGKVLLVNGTPIVFTQGATTDVSGNFSINNGKLFDASGSKQYFSDVSGNIAYQLIGTSWTDLTGTAVAQPIDATATAVSTKFGAAIDTSGNTIPTKNSLLLVDTSNLENPILTDNTGKPVLTNNKEVITDKFGYTVESDEAGRYLKDIDGNSIDKGLEVDTHDNSIVYVTDLNGTVIKDSTGQPIENIDGLYIKQDNGKPTIYKWDGTKIGELDTSGATLLAKTDGTVATYPSGGNIVLNADGTLDNANYQVLDGKLAKKNGEPVIPQIEIATDYSIAKDTSGNPITNGVNPNPNPNPVFLNNNGEIVLTNGGTTPLRDQNGNLVVDRNGYHTSDTTSPYTYKDYDGNVYQETPRILGSALTAEQLLSGIGKMKALVDSYGYTTGEPTVDQEQSKGLLPEKIKELNDLARAFAEKLNDLHDDGYTLSTASETSKQGGNFFTAGREGQDKITAANIRVSEAIRNNLNLIAASTGIDEEGNGSNAIKLASVKSEALTRLNNASAQTFYESIVADVGVKGEQANRLEYNSTTIRLTIANNRDSVSSVSLDEEMTNMITFQQAYNASARMITVVDETLDKIINGMGRVGL